MLLPLPSSSGPPKWIYPVIILIAIMVAGIGYMAYKVVSLTQGLGSGPPDPPLVVNENV